MTSSTRSVIYIRNMLEIDDGLGKIERSPWRITSPARECVSDRGQEHEGMPRRVTTREVRPPAMQMTTLEFRPAAMTVQPKRVAPELAEDKSEEKSGSGDDKNAKKRRGKKKRDRKGLKRRGTMARMGDHQWLVYCNRLRPRYS